MNDNSNSKRLCLKIGKRCIFASDNGIYCTAIKPCDKMSILHPATYKCTKYNAYCQHANSYGLCVLKGECTMYKALDIPIKNPEEVRQEILTKIEDRKKITEDTIFQLKCIKEHLKWLLKSIDEDSIEFDITVLDTCIDNLNKLNEV